MWSVNLCWEVSIFSQIGQKYLRSGDEQSLLLSALSKFLELSVWSMVVLVVQEKMPESLLFALSLANSLGDDGDSMSVTIGPDGGGYPC